MKLFRTFIYSSLVSTVLTITALSQPGGITPPQASQDDRYRIGFQDVLDIQVYRHPDLNKRVPVDPSGTIDLFRLEGKAITAVCKTERELAKDIEAAYRVSYLKDPQVSVTVVEQRSQPLSVIGAIEKPGTYSVGRQLNLLQLLALAGGPNKEAGTRLYVVRGGNVSTCREGGAPVGPEAGLIAFKIKDVYEGKSTLQMVPGDVVTVLKADIIYVYGNVTEPGPVEVREPITLTQAVASAKGLKASTAKGSVRILRQRPDSLEREEIIINLSDVEKQKVKDPYLEPNDIVAISQDATKAILSSVVRAITGGLPTIVTGVRPR